MFKENLVNGDLLRSWVIYMSRRYLEVFSSLYSKLFFKFVSTRVEVWEGADGKGGGGVRVVRVRWNKYRSCIHWWGVWNLGCRPSRVLMGRGVRGHSIHNKFTSLFTCICMYEQTILHFLVISLFVNYNLFYENTHVAVGYPSLLVWHHCSHRQGEGTRRQGHTHTHLTSLTQHKLKLRWSASGQDSWIVKV